ncbi:MAG: hypothetical protein DLM61_24905 [Pseudonocardiales bacterium]|nr:MAG: hypothetical protein DLM61_24905 [Pseudonocardiales bacterium]
MSCPARLPLWLRLAGPVLTLLGAGGAVAASAHLTALAVVPVVLAAAGVIVMSVALLRARS